MKKMIALTCLGFAFSVSTPVFAAGEKMKGCSKEATGMKGEERKAFMKKCLSKDYVLKSDAAAGVAAAPATPATPATSAASAKPAAAATPATPATPAATSAQQDRMRGCNADAKGKGLKGDERKKFMSACLKG
jgi:hypothetical protein